MFDMITPLSSLVDSSTEFWVSLIIGEEISSIALCLTVSRKPNTQWSSKNVFPRCILLKHVGDHTIYDYSRALPRIVETKTQSLFMCPSVPRLPVTPILISPGLDCGASGKRIKDSLIVFSNDLCNGCS